ncbi:MAG TPA: right-handed parallel beta-helix repeat-containing protein [Pyrinomonadaceae bacterium]|nr:right-handed parallel beta-helix repeat-containing protein [Pyrinomonadaceae bacterium]
MTAASLLSCAARQSAGAPSPSALAAEAPKAARGADAAGLYVSTRGDDSKDGSSPERALRSVSAALARARAGTTVFVAGGTYYEQVVTKAGGAEGAEITVKSTDGTAVIDGSRLDWAQGRNQNQGLVELRHPYVKLAGLKVVGSKNTGVLLAADHLTVEGCEVSEARLHGISTDTSRQTNYRGRRGTMIRDVLLRGNTVARAALSGSGQSVSIIADGFVISGNTVRDGPKEGIDIWLGARHGEVSGNTIYGNGSAGVYVDGAAYVRIHRNVVYGNRSGIGVSSENEDYSTHDVWVYNNVVYDNAEAGLFLWDKRSRPGRHGVQAVLMAHNTLVGNRHSFFIAGEDNTGEVVNNLGQSSAESVRGESARSSLVVRDNVWLPRPDGFAAATHKDFHLAAGSPAVDRGARLPPLKDDRGRTFSIDSDFDGATRARGRSPDAGAYEYR